MRELEPLCTELRRALGEPPDGWLQAQRVRLRSLLQEMPRRSMFWRVAPAFATALALAAPLAWLTLREPASEGVTRSLVAAQMREPFRFEDGSTIALAPEGRGRLVVDSAFVRFELQSGRANFDVTPGQRRTWLITAGKNEVRVVGTRFSVSYAASEAFEVQVERGIVAVRVPERSASVELKAGDQLRGRPGHMEVAHTSTALAPTTTNGEPPARGDTASAAAAPAPAGPVAAHVEPPIEPAASAEWRHRYRSGKYAESLALLRASGIPERLNELSPQTLAEVANAARLGGDPELAVRALTVLMRRFPRSPEAREGTFLLGRVHALRGDGNAAIAAFEQYLKPGGSTQYANEAVGRLMELYSARGDDARARAMATRYLQSAPEGPYRRLARSLTVPAK